MGRVGKRKGRKAKDVIIISKISYFIKAIFLKKKLSTATPFQGWYEQNRNFSKDLI